MIERAKLIQNRLGIADRTMKQEAAARKLLPFLKSAKKPAGYFPVRGELDPAFDGVLLPKVLDGKTMAFYPPDQLRKGAFGIPEPQGNRPETPDLVVVPLLGFCRTSRIGYGKGYYDRYLSEHPEIICIGLAFDEQEIMFEPESWDVALDAIITPTRIIWNGESDELKGKYSEFLEGV